MPHSRDADIGKSATRLEAVTIKRRESSFLLQEEKIGVKGAVEKMALGSSGIGVDDRSKARDWPLCSVVYIPTLTAETP